MRKLFKVLLQVFGYILVYILVLIQPKPRMKTTLETARSLKSLQPTTLIHNLKALLTGLL